MPSNRRSTVDESKSMFKSRTFWVNALTIAASFLPQVQAMLPPSSQQYVIPVLGLVNIGLRWITTGPVHVKPQ